ncbi:hypothetical protein ASF62_15445 [Leifsonia sp. Leaf325]|nr:hypothetical protein [Leifsonia sp. Leaf325]KQQ93131.1 hypothetical protein ASF62_15445 [Leifsonia sp. Leaf325]
MRVSTVRALAVAALTIAVVAGCTPTGQEADPPSATITTDEPTTATTGPPPDNGGGAIAIELPQLPIGGGSAQDPADPARQCIDVRWIAQNADGIPEGIAITVTGASFAPPIFDVVDGCAGGAPPCLGYTFDATAQNCVLAVVGNGAVFDPQAPARPTVSLAGSAECDDPESEVCSAFVAGVQADPNVAIALEFPPEGGTPDGDTTPGDTTTDDETPAGDSPQDDDGTDDGNPTDVETPSDDDTGTGD